MKEKKKSLGEHLNTSSDIEGKRIANILGVDYIGFSKCSSLFWFNDKKHKSTFVGKNFEEIVKNRNSLLKRFKD